MRFNENLMKTMFTNRTWSVYLCKHLYKYPIHYSHIFNEFGGEQMCVVYFDIILMFKYQYLRAECVLIFIGRNKNVEYTGR